MPIKKGREYRALQDFSLIPREGENDAYRVRGTAVVFDSPTCLYEYDGVKYYEVIDRHAFDGCDMSDVIMNYNHGGKVVARLRNKTLSLNITDRGVDMEADLSGTAAGRDLYEEIDGGYIDKMSFSFSVRESKYWKGAAAALLDSGAVNGGTPKEVCATDLNLRKETLKAAIVAVMYHEAREKA